jgi:hypothetical protein
LPDFSLAAHADCSSESQVLTKAVRVAKKAHKLPNIDLRDLSLPGTQAQIPAGDIGAADELPVH